MKTLNLFLIVSIITLFASCENTDSITNTEELNLEKVVTFFTIANNPTYNTKNVKHYLNNEVVSDSTFDYQNQFVSNRLITMDGLTKIFKAFSNTGELIGHKEENYDSQGRLTGLHEFLPFPSALFFTYTYNSDDTVTTKYYNELNGTTTEYRTFTKNTNGLIEKENGNFYNNSTNQIENYEGSATLQNQKLISTNYFGTVTNYNYYPNSMPANLQKTVNELNNLIIMGNELRYLAYNGNSYYKAKDSDITIFNSENYKTYFKSVYINTTVTPNVTSTTERFYYYN